MATKNTAFKAFSSEGSSWADDDDELDIQPLIIAPTLPEYALSLSLFVTTRMLRALYATRASLLVCCILLAHVCTCSHRKDHTTDLSLSCVLAPSFVEWWRRSSRKKKHLRVVTTTTTSTRVRLDAFLPAWTDWVSCFR